MAVEAGEHPRLLFRKADLPALRECAKTKEGQQIIERLREQLNGSDGESMPAEFNPVVGLETKDGSGTFDKQTGLGAYTLPS